MKLYLWENEDESKAKRNWIKFEIGKGCGKRYDT